METNIAKQYRDSPDVQAAENILRKCVHCGFCLATCPTYNLLGDELDSPRGRIYQIKQVLEGVEADRSTQLHLDRCLTCRNCETTCPSGVEYGHLLDVGRQVVEGQVERPLGQRMLRFMIKQVLPYPSRIGPLMRIGQFVRPVLPKRFAASIPVRQQIASTNTQDEKNNKPRSMILLDGCVQPSMAPATNAAAIRVLGRLGIHVTQGESVCCGAIHQHLNDADPALDMARRNIDLWWPHVENGAEAILITASGCGSMVKDYGHLLSDDDQYCDKAAKIAAISRDIGEVLLSLGAKDILTNALAGTLEISPVESAVALRQGELRTALGPGHGPDVPEQTTNSSNAVDNEGFSVAFHPPCSLQHGQKLQGRIEALLEGLGFKLLPFDDSQECCGSAGTYSIFQPKISSTLKAKKIANIHSVSPSVIATANIGCQLHLQSVTQTPVMHWIELLDAALPDNTNK